MTMSSTELLGKARDAMLMADREPRLDVARQHVNEARGWIKVAKLQRRIERGE